MYNRDFFRLCLLANLQLFSKLHDRDVFQFRVHCKKSLESKSRGCQSEVQVPDVAPQGVRAGLSHHTSLKKENYF